MSFIDRIRAKQLAALCRRTTIDSHRRSCQACFREFQEQYPEIPWLQIIGQRNELAHNYGEILVERVWLTAPKSLSGLIARLDQIVPNREK